KLVKGEELLKEIQKEKENLYKEQLDNWKKTIKAWEKKGSNGSKPPKPRKPTKPLPLKKEEISELPNLPNEWQWVKFGSVCTKIMDGTHFSPKNTADGDFKYISAKNIKEGRIDLSKISYVSEK